MYKFIHSFETNYKGILMMLIAALLISIGQMFWKLSNAQVNKLLLIGFLLYGIGAILMIFAFKYGKLSVLHPVLCSSYIFSIFFGVLVLEETITKLKVIGIALIILGIAFIGGGED